MSSSAPISSERLADHLVNYLFDNYRGSRHVRRVATWVGFLLKAVDNLPGATPRQSRTRQIAFDYKGRTFKAKYNHRAGNRGGIEIVEVLPGRGQPEGGVVLQVTTLDEAEDAYRNLKRHINRFITSN
ncbi:MAG: hypothetical protein V3U32_03300 [Anaerolineales bacterium]